jgi:hypothetical protein
VLLDVGELLKLCPRNRKMSVMIFAAHGASRLLRRVPTIVSFLNPPPTLSLGGGNLSSCPTCMDRLLFATEGVLSEVADMYPAC